MKHTLLILSLWLSAATALAQLPQPVYRYAFGVDQLNMHESAQLAPSINASGILNFGEGLNDDSNGGIRTTSGNPRLTMPVAQPFQDFTFSMWFKPVASSTQQYIFFFDSRRNRGFGQGFFARHNNTNGNIEFGSTSGWISGRWQPTGNRWYHLVCVYDQTNQQRSVYVDGTLITGTDTGFITSSHGSEMDVANAIVSDRSSYRMPAAIDEVRLYDVALTPAQVSQLNDQLRPSSVGNLVATNVTASGATLSWTAATDDMGVSDYLGLLSNGGYTQTTDLTWTVGNLAPGTSYTVQIAARDAAGNTSEYETVTFQTLTPDTEAPTAPTSFLAADITQTSANLSWTASSDNVGVTAYEIYAGRNLLAQLGNETSYALANLQPITAYEYIILARDAAGNASTSSVVNFTTTSPDPTTTLVNRFLFTNESIEDDISFVRLAESSQISKPYDRFGVLGNAVFLNGNDLSTSVASFNHDGNLTIALWVQPSTFTNEGSLPNIRPIFDTRSTAQNGVYASIDIAGQNINFGMGNNPGSQSSITAPFVPDGHKDYHLAFVIDTINKERSIYINGQLAAGPSTYTIPSGRPTSILKLGRFSANSQESLVGRLDDVHIYQGVLRPSDIEALSNMRNNAVPPTPVDLDVSNITTSTAKLTWQAGSNGGSPSNNRHDYYFTKIIGGDFAYRINNYWDINQLQPNTEYKVIVGAYNYQGNGSRDTITFTTLPNTSSNKDLNFLAETYLSPNPIKDGALKINGIPTPVDAMLYDMNGRINKQLTNVTQLSVQGLAPGLYHLQLRLPNGQTSIKRFVKE